MVRARGTTESSRALRPFRTRCGGRDKVWILSKNKHQKTSTSALKGTLFEASGQPQFVEKEKQGEELSGREKGRTKKGDK